MRLIPQNTATLKLRLLLSIAPLALGLMSVSTLLSGCSDDPGAAKVEISYGSDSDSTCTDCGGRDTDKTSSDDDDKSTDDSCHPSSEVCNGKDDNCDGRIDDGLNFHTYFWDADVDGFGGSAFVVACAQPPGSVEVSGDCNDNNDGVHPEAIEQCNDVDDDCNAYIDDGLELLTLYRDMDSDGIPVQSVVSTSCKIEPGWAVARDVNSDGHIDWDCDDSESRTFPGARELCDQKLNNCLQAVADQHCPRICSGEWPAKVGTTHGFVSVAQLDNDNELEIVAIGGGNCHAFNHDGTVLWQKPCAQSYSDISLADMNRDGVLDILAGHTRSDGVSGLIIRDGRNGAELASYALTGQHWFGASASDLDGDGDIDVLPHFMEANAPLLLNAALGIQSAPVLDEPRDGEDVHFQEPIVADLDGDGRSEFSQTTGSWRCGGKPECRGRFYMYNLDGSLYSDPFYADPLRPYFEVAQPAYGGEGTHGLYADFDGDGASDLYHQFAMQKGYIWNKAGEETALSGTFGQPLPIVAPIGDDHRIDPSGRLRFVNGAVVDIDGDGTYEQIGQAVGGRLGIHHRGMLMDGYEVTVPSSYMPIVADINQNGRLDVLYLGAENGNANCYELGEGSWDENRVLNYGLGNLNRHAYDTHSYDPYEPNDIRNATFNPAQTTNPERDSRAFRPLGLRHLFLSGHGWLNRIKAAISERQDVDYYIFYGGIFLAELDTQVKDYDLRVHVYDKDNNFLETRSDTTPGKTYRRVQCHSIDDCPKAAAKFLVEVRGHGQNDFGPWPYTLTGRWSQ